MRQTARSVDDAGSETAPFPVEHTTSPGPRPAPGRKLAFGEIFTDHMFRLDYDREREWHAPRLVPFQPFSLSPAAAVLHYAQAVFDGLKAVRGDDGRIRIFRLDRHCQRLAESAERLCIPPVPEELAAESIKALVSLDHEWVPEGRGTALYLRPTLVATEAFLGVRPAREYAFFVIASPVGGYFSKGDGKALRIFVEDTFTRAAEGGLGAVKAGANYAASLLAADTASHRGWAQVLWTDAGTHTTIQEVGTMNVFAHIGDEIATPPLDGTILSGVTRDAVITMLGRQGLAVRERPIAVQEVVEAGRNGQLREVFGTGTGAGIAPVAEIGWRDQRVRIGDGGPGPIAVRLTTALDDLLAGATPDPDGWMTDVSSTGSVAGTARPARAGR